MPAKPHEITAVPIDERFRRDSFSIMSARQAPPIDSDFPTRFSILGDSEPGEMKAHLPYRFWGRWDHSNQQYGPSFRFDSFAAAQPHGRAGVVRYLQQARHVGPATAETLWEEFRGEAVKVLRETPAKASETVGRRFPLAKAEEAAEDLQVLAAAENLTIQLMDLFDGRGFGKACVRQALKLWGAEAVEILTNDPYKSMALKGVGFLKADKFYLDLGLPPDAIVRQSYCISYSVAKACDQSGHVWRPVEESKDYLAAAIAGTNVDYDHALEAAIEDELLLIRRDADGRLWVADVRRAGAEEYCCRKIVEAMVE